MIVLCVLIQQLENQILVLHIVGETLKLHAAVLLALLVVAGGGGGPPLIILSAPLAAIGQDVFISLYRRFSDGPPCQGVPSLGPFQSHNGTPIKARVSCRDAA